MRTVLRFALAVWVFGVPARLVGQVSGAESLLHQPDQELDRAAPLSLQDARREAWARDPMLIGLQTEMEAARQRTRQPAFLDAPMVEGQIWQWPIGTLNPSNTDMYMVSVSQEFPGRGKRALRAAVVQTDEAVVQARIEARTRELDGEIRAAYLEVATARRVIDIQRSALPLLRQAVAASQVRYESGATSQSDILAGMVAVSALHNSLLELDEAYQLALVRLNTLMLREPGAPVGRLEDLPEPPPLLPVADLERLALAHHPDIAEASAMSARAAAMEKEARGDLKPDIRISGGYMFRPREGDAWLASVGLTWPNAPWARGKVDSRVAEARAEAGTAAARAEAASAAIKRQVYESYVRAGASRERVALLRSTILPQSRQAIAIAAAAYQADKADVQAVLADERMLADSQLGYVRAVSEAALAIAELERVVGATVTAGDLAK